MRWNFRISSSATAHSMPANTLRTSAWIRRCAIFSASLKNGLPFWKTFSKKSINAFCAAALAAGLLSRPFHRHFPRDLCGCNGSTDDFQSRFYSLYRLPGTNHLHLRVTPSGALEFEIFRQAHRLEYFQIYHILEIFHDRRHASRLLCVH